MIWGARYGYTRCRLHQASGRPTTVTSYRVYDIVMPGAPAWVYLRNVFLICTRGYDTVINFKGYIIVLIALMGLSIGLQMLLPFPYGLAISLGILIMFPLLLRRIYANRMRGYGGNLRVNWKLWKDAEGGGSLRYVCLVCNHRYKGGSCPRCGSKMKRADF